jgi:hypothetical protein
MKRKVIKIQLSAEQIRKLKTEPAELVPAPGPGKAIKISEDGIHYEIVITSNGK